MQLSAYPAVHELLPTYMCMKRQDGGSTAEKVDYTPGILSAQAPQRMHCLKDVRCHVIINHYLSL